MNNCDSHCNTCYCDDDGFMGFIAMTVDEKYRIFGVGVTKAEAVRRLKQKHSNMSGGERFRGAINVIWVTNGGACE